MAPLPVAATLLRYSSRSFIENSWRLSKIYNFSYLKTHCNGYLNNEENARCNQQGNPILLI